MVKFLSVWSTWLVVEKGYHFITCEFQMLILYIALDYVHSVVTLKAAILQSLSSNKSKTRLAKLSSQNRNVYQLFTTVIPLSPTLQSSMERVFTFYPYNFLP